MALYGHQILVVKIQEIDKIDVVDPYDTILSDDLSEVYSTASTQSSDSSGYAYPKNLHLPQVFLDPSKLPPPPNLPLPSLPQTEKLETDDCPSPAAPYTTLWSRRKQSILFAVFAFIALLIVGIGIGITYSLNSNRTVQTGTSKREVLF